MRQKLILILFGLSLTGLGRLLGPHLARTLALTGSDTYFPTGTDVARSPGD